MFLHCFEIAAQSHMFRRLWDVCTAFGTVFEYATNSYICRVFILLTTGSAILCKPLSFEAVAVRLIDQPISECP
jgi:hypothetical protein